MKKANKLFLFGLIMGSIALFRSKPAFAHSADGVTTFGVSENPVQLVPGNDVTVSTNTISMDSGFSSAHPEQIDNGTVVIQLATDALGSPTVSGSAAAWVAMNAGVNPNGGSASVSLDLNSWGFIPGTVGGLRAMYVSCGGSDSVKTHYSPAIDIAAAASPCEGNNLDVAVDLVSGNGEPNPGFSTLDANNPFVFGIKVRNCTGADLVGIKVQGKTNGWTDLREVLVSGGQYATQGQGKSQVVVWTLNLPQGTEQTLSMLLDARIPNDEKCKSQSADPDGDGEEHVRYLTGMWSAVYKDGSGHNKTRYTGRASVVVTCP